ncbi:MAG: hypothetical protein ACLQG5_10040 [Methanobacterium sp.]
MNADEFNNTVYDKLTEIFPNNTIYAVGKNRVNNIVLFDEPELIKQKSRYRIAYTNMMVSDGNKPILGVETIFSNSSIPPKNIVGSIPVYMITRKIIVRFENGDEIEFNLDENESKLLLLIVLSEQQSKGKKDQINDLNEKVSGVIDLNSEFSYLKDFRICEFFDIEHFVTELLE